MRRFPNERIYVAIVHHTVKKMNRLRLANRPLAGPQWLLVSACTMQKVVESRSKSFKNGGVSINDSTTFSPWRVVGGREVFAQMMQAAYDAPSGSSGKIKLGCDRFTLTGDGCILSLITLKEERTCQPTSQRRWTKSQAGPWRISLSSSRKPGIAL